MSLPGPISLYKGVSDLIVVCLTDVTSDSPSVVSDEQAALAQLNVSQFLSIAILFTPDFVQEALKSIVNEVALKKLTISNTDLRAVIVKDYLVFVNDLYPESIKFSKTQLNFNFPTLAPF
jgi:hypothetical protein